MNHVVLVAKMNDIHMKGKQEEFIGNFYNGLQRDMENEFQIKVTGYAVIYAPYYICFLESEDSDFLDFCLNEIQNSKNQQHIHEQVWCLFATEEVPSRAFDQFEVRSFPAQQSQAEVRSVPLIERVQKIYLSMIQIGNEVRRVMNDPTKTKVNVESVYQTQSIQNLPAQEDLQSVIGPEMQTLEEHLEFYTPPDIVLEDELCWPVKPDLDY